MKKYHYSKNSVNVAVILFIFGAFVCPIILKTELANYQPSNLLTIIMVSMGIICSIYLIYWSLSIWLSMDENKVIMHVHGKKYEHGWNDFADCGITVNQVRWFGNDKAIKMIYLSTKKLTSVEKVKINDVVKKRWSEIVYFEYEKQLFNEILTNLPKPLQAELRKREQEIFAEYPE